MIKYDYIRKMILSENGQSIYDIPKYFIDNYRKKE